MYVVEHRIKNCSHFLHSPTGYEKTQREIAQEMYIWNAENYWKGVGLGTLKYPLVFYGYFTFMKILIKRNPTSCMKKKRIWKYNVFRRRRQFHVKCIPWHLAKTFAAFKHTAAVRNWFSHLNYSKKVLRWSLFMQQNLRCGQIWAGLAV